MAYLHMGAPISLVHRDLKSSNVLILEFIEKAGIYIFSILGGEGDYGNMSFGKKYDENVQPSVTKPGKNDSP